MIEGAQSLHQFIAIHLGHEDVGDDQIGMFGDRLLDRFETARCRQQTVPLISQKRG